MKASGSSAIMSIVAAVTFSFTASPASAAPLEEPDYAFENTTQQISFAQDRESMLRTIESFEIVIDGVSTTDVNGNGHNFDVAATIAAAVSEIGSVRPTGWNQPGECLVSAQRWIRAGGGKWVGSGNPVANYVGAQRIALDDLTPGDVIQYEYIDAPTAWATGVHTVLVVGTNADGTLTIIESNNPGGTGLVRIQEHWKPAPPAGFQAVGWRF